VSTSDLPNPLQPFYGKEFSCQSNHQNAIVQSITRKEMTTLKTAEELSELLAKEAREWVKGDRRLASIDSVFTAGIWNQAKAEMPDNGLVKMATLIESLQGEDGARSTVNAIVGYQEFREQVQNYQVANNISSIVWRSQIICGRTICYPESCCQLICLESDLDLMRTYVEPVCKVFLEVCAGYDVGVSLDDETFVPSTVEDLQKLIASKAGDRAYLFTESYDWGEPNEDGGRTGHMVDRDPPDEITLAIRFGNPSIGSSGEDVYLRAQKPE